ncbi:MAG: family 10 glycosylhydrolase [Bacteroidetes bacterium]|nr:family 10 glycosylhydrolase [Bacteroidota bacterium]MCH8524647.1 family 10 glycosylhydrolase [Balneolales bacterium]
MKLLFSLLVVLYLSSALYAQKPVEEMRGAWIATVANLDWPTSRSVNSESQKTILINQLDGLKKAGINTIFFQVRTEGDALYNSSYEPWSYYLSGTEGIAPDPFWDPLEFVIKEAHKRGMELHAWLNPYRAERVIGLFPRAESHVTNANPEMLLTSGTIRIFDPGLPETKELITRVVMDIVRRYNVDGIHFDDYFYPYPPNNMTVSDLQDAQTFQDHNRGFTNIADWRRDNINRMVEAVHDSIKAVKPFVKFGISPFGIYKNATPIGITGMDAYSVIYADPLAWLNDKTVDYLTPQLYWQFGGRQDYALLSQWWSQQTSAAERHLYTGNAPYRFASPSNWPVTEILNQLDFNRENPNIHGNVLFRARFITGLFISKGLSDSLASRINRIPSVPPGLDWIEMEPLTERVDNVQIQTASNGNSMELSWNPVQINRNNNDSLVFYLVYRVNNLEFDGVLTEDHVVALTGETHFEDTFPSVRPMDLSYSYYVQAVGRNATVGPVSEPANVLIETSIESSQIAGSIILEQNFPNPFNPTTSIRFHLPETSYVELTVYDLTGRVVSVIDRGMRSSGTHQVNFDATNLTSGMYLYRLEAAGTTLTGKMTLIK